MKKGMLYKAIYPTHFIQHLLITAVNLIESSCKYGGAIMRQQPANPTGNKPIAQDECCDLYNEYCYPCNSGSTVGTLQQELQKKAQKTKKRSAD